ncbi:DNA polymerase [Thermodesulfobacteriota bacterium]
MERESRVTWPRQVETDLIRIVMLRLAQPFRERTLRARLVMMIHDSLRVEAPSEEAALVRELMRDTMELAQELSVRLEVDFE